MVAIRPADDRLNWSPSETDVEVPSGAKQSLGFRLREKLGSKVANGLFKRLCQWLNWGVDRIDAHETTGNVTFDLTTDDWADVQTYFADLKHNDYNITLTGAFDDNTETLTINSITGSGSIIFSGNVTLGGVSISNVSNSVRFNAELNIESSATAGLYCKNTPYVYVNELNVSFESAPTASSTLVKLENSKLVVLTPDFDGRFTSASAPTYLIRLDGKSHINLGTDYNVTTNAIAGSSIGRSMIRVEEGGYFDTAATAIFDANWAQNYACQLEMNVYPKSEQIYYINTETGITYAKAIILGIKEVNCAIENVGINNNVSHLEISNISGAGSITINGAKFILDNFISNCLCDIYLTDIEIADNGTSGKYGLSVTNCRNVQFLTQTVLDSGSDAEPCLLIDNSNARFEDLRNTNTYSVGGNPTYVDIKNNSNVQIDRILSGGVAITNSKFISISDACRVHITSWVPSNVGTTNLQFNAISNASYVVGWTSANKYILATRPADITIIELP